MVFNESKLFYNVLAITGSVAAEICIVMIRHLRHSENTSTIFASQCMFTLIIAIVIVGDRLLIHNINALGFTLMALITVVCGQLAITESFRHINVTKGSTLQMLAPALTVLLSSPFLGEHFSMLELIS